MLKYFFLSALILSFVLQTGYAQLKEDFSDGNITQNPVWTGNLANFIVNSHLQLQSNSTEPNDIFFIATKNKIAVDAEWEFWIRLAFNTSSVNYADVFLISNEPDLTSTSNRGYFLRFGGTADEISLYRMDEGGKTTKIIDGQDGTLNSSNNILKIKVIRDASHNWSIFYDKSASGNQYKLEGTINDSVYLQSSWFGVLIKQSTASFFQKHFFDDFVIQKHQEDKTPPQIDSVIATSAHSLDVYFNEPIHDETASQTFNFYVSNGIGMPQSAVLNASNPALLQLTFATAFQNRNTYELLVKDVQDLWGNQIKEVFAPFTFNIPLRYDILISEIFADPNPTVALPPHKFIELYNRSAFSVNLGGWLLSEGNNRSVLPAYIMAPGSYLILTSTGSASAYTGFGSVLGVPNFPNLPVSGGLITLSTAEGSVMHAVEYHTGLYENDVKRDGGWSLEIIDVERGCEGLDNWGASINSKGGTPGKANSISQKSGLKAPKLNHSYFLNDRLVLVFDQSLDSLSAVKVTHFNLQNQTIIEAEAVAPLFREVRLKMQNEIAAGEIFEININGIMGCDGTAVREQKGRFGVIEIADSTDVVINEILFNPPPGGVDYVELFNRSQKVVNLRDLYLANRNSRGEIGGIIRISEENVPFYPNDFLLLSIDKALVMSNYISENKDVFLDMKSFPSYPNSSGNVILLNQSGSIIDEVAYSEKWHHSLVKNPAGVSLERIDPHGASVSGNFHSAAASVGFGTPGYRNSQHKVEVNFKGEIRIEPEIFSPDGDGIDDFIRIHYKFPETGYIANIKVFNAQGRLIKHLEKTSITGTKGYFKWDGLDEKNQQLPQGIYIIYTQIYNTSGKSRVFKNSVVLGRR